ncbi:hypothetical protein [Paenibacillus paridis]|uniref:hypothetical protein n=1 Tax=Paenibacillus paridis TaxID=2583376 RepID=UPI00111EA5DF|nr:hypothetical protein [Paenibacillus paridis]
MDDARLRAKQEKLQLENDKVKLASRSPQAEHAEADEHAELSSANAEWQKFYSVIKEITSNMRY